MNLPTIFPDTNECKRLYREHLVRELSGVTINNQSLVCDSEAAFDALLKKMDEDSFYGWGRNSKLPHALSLHDLTMLGIWVGDWDEGMAAIGCLVEIASDGSVVVTEEGD